MSKAQSTTFKIEGPLVLLTLTALMAPLFGGYISTDQTTLSPGLPSLLAGALGGSDAPILGHALISLPLLLGLVWAFAVRKIQQTPKQLFTTTWVLFFAFLGFSTVFSSFKSISLQRWIEWDVYGCAMFAVVALGGRKLGPKLLTYAMGLGCVWIAVKGFNEYHEAGPTWRVFAGWMNPNASAAVMLVGFFLWLGLSITEDRLASFLSGAFAVVIALGISLTGSKGAASLGLPLGTIAFGLIASRTHSKAIWAVGGVLGLITGLAFLKNFAGVGIGLSLLFAVGLLFARGAKTNGAALGGRVLAIFIAATILIAALNISGQKQVGTSSEAKTPISRVAQGSLNEDQSTTFRLNLWKSALFLAKERPLTGFGLGTYQYESTRSGLTTATVFAHNSYLEMLAEAGIIPVGLFLFGVGTWFWVVGRNRETAPGTQSTLLAGTMAAVVGLLSHSLVDSDLSYFGLGLMFFILLGIGLCLGVDSVAPELTPKPLRGSALFALGGLIILMFLFSHIDDTKAIARGDLRAKDANAFKDEVQGLDWASGFDGEAAYLSALILSGDTEIAGLQKAYELAPTEKAARYLARVEGVNGKAAQGIGLLKQALTSDPKNLHSLNALMTLQRDSGDADGAIETAKRLVAVEATPYFKIRSIPESVPTETYQARMQELAPYEKDPRTKADLLAGAVEGMLDYVKVTLWKVKKFAKDSNSEEDAAPGFDSLKDAKSIIGEAADSAKEASTLYTQIGSTDRAQAMKADEELLRKALVD